MYPGNFTGNGLACVEDADSEDFGYIDKKGDYVIEPILGKPGTLQGTA